MLGVLVCEETEELVCEETEEKDRNGKEHTVLRYSAAPAQAARALTRAAVALPDENDSAWELLEACGLRRG